MYGVQFFHLLFSFSVDSTIFLSYSYHNLQLLLETVGKVKINFIPKKEIIILDFFAFNLQNKISHNIPIHL